ncbi:MAG: LPS export ABC transporter periplasmic protein LptC [Alphaproteobacteria bacterium]|nr:LPS export ABC transporter periplasmic protein LptC [Alphaproteobacteria bacterium]
MSRSRKRRQARGPAAVATAAVAVTALDLPAGADPAPVAAPARAHRDRPRLTRFVAASMRRRRYNVLYSRAVALMKVIFPAAALGLAALVLFWPQINPLQGRFRLKPVQVSIDDLSNLRMMSPRVLGTDKKNEPYTITAELATQAAGGSDVTDLKAPKGDISLTDGSWIEMNAEQGQYNKKTRVLDLWTHVNVFHDSGYELRTERAIADLGQGSVTGDDPVEGHGPDSSVQGEGFRIYDKGGRIVVTGKSKLVIYPQQQAQAQPPQSQPAQAQKTSSQPAQPSQKRPAAK